MMPASRKNLTGRKLNELWGVGANHALYSEGGNWYHQLTRFPGALFDANGYIVFRTKEDYDKCESLRITKDLNIPSGISSIAGYVRIAEKSSLQAFSQRLKEQQAQYQSSETNNDKNVFSLEAFDMPDGSDVPERVLAETYRIIRDTKIAKKIKLLHGYKCQICGNTIDLGNGKFYAEAHHIRPLGREHNGPDIIENILCLCPNHHVQLDFGAIKIHINDLRTSLGHEIGDEYVQYHNLSLFQGTG